MTLYEYIKQTEDFEIAVFDKDYDIEVYFYKSDSEELDDWDKSMEKLSKLLTVENISSRGVVTNLSELIKNKLKDIEKSELFYVVDIDYIMDDIEPIISGNVSEDWLKEFVNSLA